MDDTILFILSPAIYLGVSVYDETKRTDFPGKEIARLVQNKWNENFINEIKIVIGDEWSAGNLSYHLNSRPVWTKDLKNKTSEIKENTSKKTIIIKDDATRKINIIKNKFNKSDLKKKLLKFKNSKSYKEYKEN